ncbi:MAG: STAS domain-containing protein [Methanoregula sp.]|jgi:anti-anti-sigma factor|nr:STAS domain-containing protein [Methanoregula sp.]
MTIETTTIDDTCIVAIPERLDGSNAPVIETELRQILAGTRPKNIIFDFSETNYLASAGMRVVLQLSRDPMKAGGRVILVGLRPTVHKVLAMAGFTSIFTICTSREEALQKMK